MAFEIFGFKIERKSQELAGASVPAFTLPESDDGSQMVSGAGALGYSLDMDGQYKNCLLYTSPSPRDATLSRMPSSA